MLTALPSQAVPLPEFAGPWAGFTRTQPQGRYEQDVGANFQYAFGVTRAFSPYQDPDMAEARDLPNPLDNPAFASYRLIVIVNKQAHPFWGPAQTLRVYQRGKGLLYYWLVSSGARGYETTSGYFRPTLFSSRHWSSKYDAPMMWAVFFNGGMALHSSLDRSSLKEMGHAAASHGCVHLEDYRSEELFHLIGQSGFGTVDLIDGKTGRRTGGKVSSYKTLIIVAPVTPWAKVKKPPARPVAPDEPATTVVTPAPLPESGQSPAEASSIAPTPDVSSPSAPPAEPVEANAVSAVEQSETLEGATPVYTVSDDDPQPAEAEGGELETPAGSENTDTPAENGEAPGTSLFTFLSRAGAHGD